MRRALIALIALTGTLASARPVDAYCRTTTARTTMPGACSITGALLNWQGNCIGFSVFTAGSPQIPIEIVETTADEAAGRWRAVACDANSTTQPYFEMKRLCYDGPDGTVCPRTTTPTGYNSRGPDRKSVV